ncbi:GDSL-type esterase/lipase family protein [Fictibacillus phosphorivorans]|uniref:GDSL-type esterase/lipase family protein n=1 Tax=Fictibacillus phosphorivorans TaxID=1221500 RepID=UPI00203B9E5C|nr:GDSL-type esterase/lipase family protein [Fictibacillus phosphorivorans]MCM3717402.1 GDSL-type esterase/lipase family protein [Fictibacillus phosphorivorans]MCM3775097.1 GDSL-type esterase/lipase family protein [Fictibacillus phosphorivorans]
MKKYTLTIVSAVSIAATLLWLFGLGWTLQDQFTANEKFQKQKEKTESATSKKEDGNLTIFALGDSLTRGTGDADGKGYVGYLSERLKKKSEQDITLFNTAIKGETSRGLLKQLRQSEIQRQVKQADVIMMTIGGNDLFQQGKVLESLDKNAINGKKQIYLRNIKNIYKQLRELNQDAVIYHVGLYNPFSNLQDAKTTSSIVRDWNFQTAETAAQFNNIVYVPTFDLFQLQVENYLYSDQFHLNTEGYKLIAERVASLVHFEQEEKNDE